MFICVGNHSNFACNAYMIVCDLSLLCDSYAHKTMIADNFLILKTFRLV